MVIDTSQHCSCCWAVRDSLGAAEGVSQYEPLFMGKASIEYDYGDRERLGSQQYTICCPHGTGIWLVK